MHFSSWKQGGKQNRGPRSKSHWKHRSFSMDFDWLWIRIASTRLPLTESTELLHWTVFWDSIPVFLHVSYLSSEELYTRSIVGNEELWGKTLCKIQNKTVMCMEEDRDGRWEEFFSHFVVLKAMTFFTASILTEIVTKDILAITLDQFRIWMRYLQLLSMKINTRVQSDFLYALSIITEIKDSSF